MTDKIKKHMLSNPNLEKICQSVAMKAYTELLLPEYEMI